MVKINEIKGRKSNCICYRVKPHIFHPLPRMSPPGFVVPSPSLPVWVLTPDPIPQASELLLGVFLLLVMNSQA